jgi:hypothetical protein
VLLESSPYHRVTAVPRTGCFDAEFSRKPAEIGHRPRGSERRTFEGILRLDGIEVDGKVFSPSYAAVHCIQKAGSSRKTANGWVMWRTESGELLVDLYNRIRRMEPARHQTDRRMLSSRQTRRRA